jgi:hypothetical protein
VGKIGLGFKFGMELGGHEKWMIWILDDFDEALFFRDRGDDESGLLELVLVIGVEFIPVAVALMDSVGSSIEFMGFRAGNEDGLAGTQSHGASHIGDALLFLL